MKEIKLQNYDQIRKIYFVGIKGVGMVGLALMAKEAGFEVAGSDVAEEFLTDSILEKFNIPVDINFNETDLELFASGNYENLLVVTTAAHNGLSNPQCVFAKKHNIPVLTHGQAVGYFMQGQLFKKEYDGISVLGCHGKTTISAFVSSALAYADLDPTYTVGTSEIFPNKYAGHFGSGKYFVAEADEFVSDVKEDKTVKFLYQHPEYAIINNIDFDHPDVYKNIGEVVDTFRVFCLQNVLQGGTLIVNGDDAHILEIIKEVKIKRPDITVVTYGQGEKNNYKVSDFKEEELGSVFTVCKNGLEFGSFSISIPGFYNAKNSLSVIALLDALGISKEKITAALKEFKGTKRRQELIGNMNDRTIVLDDYAHHPDEIDKTLSAIKRAYSTHKIIAIFQPHTISRTESLKDEFSKAFKHADLVVFLPIFTSKREGELDYQQLYRYIEDSLKKNGTHAAFLSDKRTDMTNSPYFLKENRVPVIKYIQRQISNQKSVVVTLGAGDIYKIAYDMVDL